MILDFNDLTITEQNQAVDNLIKMNDSMFVSYLLREGKFESDLWGWFNIHGTEEGWEYWDNIRQRINKEKTK